MSALAKKSIFLLGMLTLIVLATLWAWPGTAQGASLDVTKTADTDDGACDADCSLREAIAAALAGDTINVPIGTYTLTMGTELIINVDLTLTGAGSGDTIIQAAASSADATSRVFNITSATVAISDVTIQNANTVGAGGGIINSFGTLTLTNSTVSENTAGGGGISNFGTATLTNSTVTGNTASGGGGISNEPGSTLVINSSTISGNTAKGAFGSGGGIVNWVGGTVTLTGSAVTGNTAESDGGGIYNDSDVTLAGSTVSGNTANLNGGGIWNGVNGTVTLTDSTVSGNIALGASFVGGGGIYNDGTLTMANSAVSGNSSDDIGAGIFNDSLGTVTLTNSIVSDNSINVSNKAAGGIYNGGGTLTLTNSTVSGNMATGGGGGIRNIGTLILTSSTVSGNASTDSNGGGIYNAGGTVTLTDLIVSGNMATENVGGLFNSGGTLILTNSIVSGNSAILNGGGIAFTSGTATLANSTVSGNTAEFGGGIYSAGGNAADFGGGIYNFGGTVTLTNSTVSGNTVTDGGNGGGIDNFSGTIELVNTIIAENTAAGGPDCLGSLTSLGYNLIGDDTDCGYTAATGDLLNVGPLLGPLQDNGGPTFTHALLAGSPAIDAIPVADCNDINGVPVTTDQRGVARPQGSDCDIGSFELEPPPDPECTLNLALTYVDGTLTMEFEVGTLEPAQWGIWFLAQGNVSLKRKAIMGVTDPPILVSRSIPGYPAQGTVGVLTSLSTQGSGAICSAWQTVDTGTP